MANINITLKDIAALAHCSVNTVSLALKNSPRISEATRQKVQQIAKENNYISNNMARALVSGQTKTIGLILRDISSHLLTTEASYIEHYLERQGYSMLVMTSHNDPAIEAKAINLMLSNCVDGLIVNTALTENLSRLESLREQGFPIVMISGFERPLGIDSISPDLVKGAYAATQRLLDLGHKKIVGVFGDRASSGDEMKLHGFRLALEQAGLCFDAESICAVPDLSQEPAAAVKQVLEAVRRGVTGMFVSSDELAIPLMKVLHQQGVSIPQEVAVTSMDNIRFAESASVALTSVGYDLKFISRHAVEMLLQIIQCKENDMEGSYQNIRVEPKLYIRESCGNLLV